jgi:hypothetical protein
MSALLYIEVVKKKMATPKKKTPTKKAASPVKTKKVKVSSSAVDSVAKGLSDISISATNLFSFKTIDQVFERPNVSLDKNGVMTDFYEVDVFVGTPVREDSISLTLAPDGRQIHYKKATPEMFGEEDRMKADMGGSYRRDHPRVLAHNATCQMIRTTCKAKDGKFWPADEDMQIIELNDKCRGAIIKKFSVYPTKFPIDGNVQYSMVMTLRIELDIQPVRREKKGKIEVHQALDDFDEYDDFDDGMPAVEIDEDDGMGLGNVGS